MLKSKQSKKNLIITAVIIFLLIFLHGFKVLSPVESFIVTAFKPVFTKAYSVTSVVRRIFKTQADKEDMSLEITRLEERISELTIKNVRLKELEEENNNLRQYLKFMNESSYDYAMAGIMSAGGLDSSGVSQMMVIDKGAKDGLKPGLAVVSNEGIIVGKVISVKDGISEVCLTTNQKCRLAATVQNDDKTSGVAEGDLGLTIKMGFIPQTKEVKAGDVVITSGLEQNIPRGLVIGSVSKVTKENNELWQSATIEPIIDPSKLLVAAVILQK